MSMLAPLPPRLSGNLELLARRVRRLRLLRGVCVVVVTLTLCALAALLLDGAVGASLPRWLRVLDLGLWFLAGFAVVRRALILPLRHPADVRDLAAAVECQHPELQERLLSSVELTCDLAGPANSDDLLVRLLEETDRRTQGIDFPATVPSRSTRLLAWLTGLLLVATVVPAAVMPASYGRLWSRFLLPWYSPRALPEYALTVSPGDVVAARGQRLSIQARVAPRRSKVALPSLCTLVLIDESGTSSRLDMAATEQEPALFSTSFTVTASSRYRVEAGNAVSPEFSLVAVTPTDLAADSPVIVITPPAYASTVIDRQKRTGMVDFTAFAHSKIAVRFTFDHPATAVTLLWKPQEQPAQNVRLELADGGRSAAYSTTARTSGSYRLIIEGEHGLRTERDGGSITVLPDQPPQVLAATTAARQRLVGPNEPVLIEQTLTDDIAVASAELLSRTKGKAEQVQPLVLQGAGTQQAVVRHTLTMPERTADGTSLEYRLRFRDNRPQEFGGPQVRYFPESGYLSLKVDQQANALREKEIEAKRDAIDSKIKQIESQLKYEKRRADKIRVESRDQPQLSGTDRDDLNELARHNQTIEQDLEKLAQEMAEDASGARQARHIAQQRMRPAESGLRDAAAKEAEKAKRDQRLADTDRELDEALRQLAELREKNQQHAQAQLDRLKVQKLADKQQQLARQAASDPSQSEEVARQQKELARQLDELTRKSDSLKKAEEATRGEQAREAAEQARELAQAQRDLAQASEQIEKKRDAETLAELEKQQRALERKVEELARQTAAPTRANYTRPLSPKETRQAADALKGGEPSKALQAQDRSSRELERLAGELDRLSEQGDDPREAVRQLARLQDDLARQVRDEEAKRPLADRLRDLQRAQEALRQAVRELNTPKSKEARARQQQAEREQAAAAQALGKNDTREGLAQMEKARQSLRDLAKKVPTERQPGDKKPALLPSKQQAEQARELAKQQRQLRQQTRQANDAANRERQKDGTTGDNRPTARLAREQAEVAKQAAELARQVEQEQGAKAAPTGSATAAKKSSADAARDLQSGALEQANQSGEKTAQSLRKLSDELSKKPAAGQDTSGAHDTPSKARRLAQRQEALNRQLQPLANDRPAQRRQQQARQEELARQARELTGKLQRLSQPDSRPGNSSAREAAEKAQQAESAMKSASNQSKQGNQPGTQAQRDQAAKMLDQTAWRAEQSAQSGSPSAQARADAQAGKAVQQARRRMGQAQKQLDEGDTQNAQQAMQQAAEKLRQAANQLGRASQPAPLPPGNRPGTRGPSPSLKPDASMFPKELASHVGKRWGELPGELRTRMVQQMQARYGDDYARSIKLYFEQLADTHNRR